MANTRGMKAGNAFITFSLDSKAFQKQLGRLQKRLASVGTGLQRIGKAGLAVGGAFAAGFGASLKIFSDTGDELNKMSARTGFSAQSLSELSFAAQQSGTDLKSVEKAIKGMQRSILDGERGLTTATDNLDDLGISLDQLEGKSPEKQFDILVDALADVEDPSRRAAIAMKLFGKSGADLLPLLNNGTDGIAALREEAVALGITMGDDQAQAAADFTDALGRLWKQIKQVSINIAAAVAGPLTSFLATTRPLLKTVLDWIKNNGQLIRTIGVVALAVFGMGGALVSAGIAFSILGVAVGGLSAALAFATSAVGLLLSPIVLIPAAIAGAITAFVMFTDAGQEAFGGLMSFAGEMKDIVLQSLSAISTALAAGDVAAAGKVLWATLKLLWLKGTQGIRTKWHEMTGGLIKVWHTIWAAVITTLNGAVENVIRAFSHVKEFFLQIGDGIFTGLRKMWNGTIAFFKRMWQQLKGFFGADVQGEIDRINEELGEANQKLQDEKKTRQRGRKQKAEAERQKSRDFQKSVADNLAAELAKSLERTDDGTQAKIEATEAALAKATEDWKGATVEAQKAGEKAAEDAKEKAKEGEEAAEETGKKAKFGGARGVFNAAAIGALLGGPGTVAERTAQATEEAAKELKKMNKKDPVAGP